MKLFKKKPKPKTEKDWQEEEYTRLGKALTRAIVRDNIQVAHNWRRYIFLNFVRGLFVGLGSVVGATILVALALWLLNAFGGLPFVGEWFESLQEALKTRPAAG